MAVHRRVLWTGDLSTADALSDLRGILLTLTEPANQTLKQLARAQEAEPLDRSLDVQVSRLRHRLGDDPRDPRLIKTVRGEGYVLAVAVTATGAP